MPMQAWCARPLVSSQAGADSSERIPGMPVPVGCGCVMAGIGGRTPRACEPRGVQGAPAAERICMAHSTSRSHYSFHHHIESCQMRLWGVWLQAHGDVAQAGQEEEE